MWQPARAVRVGTQARCACTHTDRHAHARLAGTQVRWSKAQWKPTKSADGRSITFAYTSKDGESG